MAEELVTILDHIRWAASRFNAAGLVFGHSYDNALDEATHLVLHSLHLPHDVPPVYAQARLTAEERADVRRLIARRIDERIPVAYLTGEAWFAGLSFEVDPRVLVPRSPIAELIENGFAPWLDGLEVQRALDLCTGSGCIGIAMAVHNPDWEVDLVDLSEGALELAERNLVNHGLERRVRALQSDLFSALDGETYELIVSNPPYVEDHEVDVLPAEYAHEPELGLRAGADGLDLCLRILRDAPRHLAEGGLLIVEVGEAQYALGELLPQVPLVWLEFDRGGDGVFLITREDLVAHADAIAARAAEREQPHG